MTRTFRFTAGILLAAAFCGAAAAGVPGILHYQGRVTVGGVDFQGQGAFRFELLDGAGGTILWSNGTAEVSLPVENGLFAAAIGDVALPGMAYPVPASLFTNDDVRLRVWFDGGSGVSTLVSAERVLPAAGYALMGANVPDGSIGAGSLADGAVAVEALAPGSVSGVALASGAVARRHIAAGAVGSSQLTAGGVIAQNLAAGAVDADALASNAVTAAHLAPASIGADELAKPMLAGEATVAPDFGQGQFTVEFSPAFDTIPMVTLAIETDSAYLAEVSRLSVQQKSPGAFTGRWSMPEGAAPAVPDAAGTVGEHVTLAVVDGHPAMAYRDASNQALKYVRATDAAGTAWGTPVTVDTNGNPGAYASLAVVDGNPAIGYYDEFNGDLKYVRAMDAGGTAWGAPVTVDGLYFNVGAYVSLAVVNGRPAMSYHDQGTMKLKYIRASDAQGAAWSNPPVVPDNFPMFGGTHTALAVVNGNPAICYYDQFAGLKYIRANDADGAFWGFAVSVDNSGTAGWYASMTVVDGRPAVAYYDFVNGDVLYKRALDAAGQGWGTTVTVDAAGDVGRELSLAVIGGRPAVSYDDLTAGDLKYARALDAAGAAWGAPLAVDAALNVGQYTALTEVGGKPAIGYFDGTNGDVKYIRGVDAPPFTILWMALEP